MLNFPLIGRLTVNHTNQLDNMKNNNFISSLVKYYFNAEELFEDFDIKKLSVKRKALQHRYGQHVNTRNICCRVFIYFLYLIILDIIRNNITFIFPIRRTFILGIKILEGQKLKEYVRRKDSEMYDYIGSGFVLPRITLFYEYRKKEIKTKEVILNYSLNKEFFDNINNGKVYG